MNDIDSSFPIFPSGFWRRIALHPYPALVIGGLEDDVHRFQLRLSHAQGKITGVETKIERYPWSTCSDAGEFLIEQLLGKNLHAIAELDVHNHCTHLFDLAILCAAHAENSAPIRFDIQVADRVEQRTTATLLENGTAVLQWQLNGTLIEGPDEWASRDLRALSSWKHELSSAAAMHALLLRRAIFVSGVRAYPDLKFTRAADRGTARLGACFTYQLPRALEAIPSQQPRIDFSQGSAGPLQGFDPQSWLAAGKKTP